LDFDCQSQLVAGPLQTLELERSLAARVKRGLNLSMFNGKAYRGFDEITEG